MTRLILALSLLASSAFAATEYPLSDRIRMHEQACYTNAPVSDRAAWIAACLREGPTR